MTFLKLGKLKQSLRMMVIRRISMKEKKEMKKTFKKMWNLKEKTFSLVGLVSMGFPSYYNTIYLEYDQACKYLALSLDKWRTRLTHQKLLS